MSERQNKPNLNIQRDRYAVAVVQAQFNSEITDKQTHQAKKCANQYGVACESFTVAGAYELPQMLDRLALTKKYDALVAIGCLIKGETTHFEIISEAAAQGIMHVSLQHHLPVGFGVITALTKEQAVARTLIGYDAMYAVLQSLSELPPIDTNE